MNAEGETASPHSLRGVLIPIVTAMDAKGEIRYPQLAEFVDYLVGQGVHGLVPLGSTGEYYALSAEERERVLRTTLETAAGRVPVLAGANAGSTREVVEFSKQAESLGCDGVMLAAPYYSLPRPEELFEHFRAVNNEVGIPIMLYNYPGRTGVDMTPDLIEKLTELKNIRYVKESTGAMQRVTELIRRCGERLGVFCGCDTIGLECLTVGAVGWVGGVANILPASHVKLYDLVTESNDPPAALRLFFEMLPLLELMENGGKYTQWVKAGCGLMGHDCGPPRRPLGPASEPECSQLRAALLQVAEGRDALKKSGAGF